MTYHKYAVSLCGDVALWREQTVEVQGEVEPGVFITGTGWFVSKEYREPHVEHEGSCWICSFISKDEVKGWEDILIRRLRASLESYKEMVVAEVQSSISALTAQREYRDGGQVSRS